MDEHGQVSQRTTICEKNYFAILVTKILCLIHMSTFLDVIKPFSILGGRSHTPFSNFKRYRTTVNKIINWHKGEPWNNDSQAYENIKATRRMHTAVRNKVSRLTRDEFDAAACTFANPWCPDREILQKDFARLGKPDVLTP